MGASGQDLPAHEELRVLSTAVLDSTAILILIPQRKRSSENQPEGVTPSCRVSGFCRSLSCAPQFPFYYSHSPSPPFPRQSLSLLRDFSECPAPTRTYWETEKQFREGDTGRCGHSSDSKPDYGVVGVSLLESTL